MRHFHLLPPHLLPSFLLSFVPSFPLRRPQPTWKWGDQDGGVGTIGTITNTRPTRGWVTVKWERGSTQGNNYRYDLAEGHVDVIPVQQAASARSAAGGAGAAGAAAVGLGHSGAFRSDPERKRCCSIPRDADGPLCTHSMDGCVRRPSRSGADCDCYYCSPGPLSCAGMMPFRFMLCMAYCCTGTAVPPPQPFPALRVRFPFPAFLL